MDITDESEIPLEILVSTMNRNSLDFLYNMFKNNDISKYQILIINQTSKGNLLHSNASRIRVINSFEKGLSRSRNLAIKNAIGSVCLFADDDVVFEPYFTETIITAFENYKDAGLIHFKAFDFKGNDYRFYPKQTLKQNIKSIKGIMSIELVFKKDIVRKNNIMFDERFGLGSQFETGEEYLFTRSILKKGISVYFYNKSIVSHDIYNSGKELGSDKIVYARAALNYSIHMNLVFFWIFKYLYFLLSNNYIKFSQVLSKVKIAVKGIKDFKNSE